MRVPAQALTAGSLPYHRAYHWLHIPSNKTGKSEGWFLDRPHFLEALAEWNRMTPTIWKYWEAGE